MLFDLTDRGALVVGGATGIGFAIATALADAGARVMIASRREAIGAAAADSIEAAYRFVDATDSRSMDDLVRAAEHEVGPLRIAVNSAGGRLNKPAELTTDDEWDEVFAANMGTVFRGCRAQGKAMLEHGTGSIINIASMSALVVNTPQTQSAYNASKAAVVMYTRSIAAEWAPRGVRVNSVSPGYTATAMTQKSRSEPEKLQAWLDRTPQDRVAEPEEIAGSAVYLASDAASFVTGHNIVADGGYSLW